MQQRGIHRRRGSMRLGHAIRWWAESLEPRLLLSTYTVTSFADSGPGTLRDAITNSAADTIQLVAGTIFLSSQLEITRSVTINGPNFAATGISGQNLTRVFQVDTNANVQMTGVTMTAGRSGSFAGAIFNLGSLTLNHCTIINSSAGMLGGAIANSGTLTMSGCTLMGNSSGTSGGAIVNAGTVTVTATTTFSNNHAPSGGALENDAGATARLTGATFSTNTATNGGAIQNAGSIFLTSSTLSGNTASSGAGGGIDNSANLDISSSTLTNNQASVATSRGRGQRQLRGVNGNFAGSTPDN